jgi:hypothetical protein
MRVRLKRLNKGSFWRIKIPKAFRDNPPTPTKIIDKMLRFSRESELDDILVDENFVLLDGYCSYLIAQQVGVGFVKIKQVRSVDNA